jgi:ADP-heptose:LPS heptosyltransferase
MEKPLIAESLAFKLSTGAPDSMKWAKTINGDKWAAKTFQERTKGKRWMIVSRSGPLGDFVLSLPLLLDIQAKYGEQYNMEWVIPGHYITLAKLAGVVGGFTDIWSAMGSRTLCDPPQTVGGSAILFHSDKNSVLSQVWSKRGYTVLHAGNMRYNDSIKTHARDRGYDTLLDYNTIVEKNHQTPIFAHVDADPLMGQRTAIIHPGTGNPGNKHGMKVWRAVIRRLIGASVDIIVTAGPKEVDWCAGAFAHEPVIVVKPDLVHLTQLLRGCIMYFGSDTGVTHLAGECCSKGSALWRGSSKVRWRPYFSESISLIPTKQNDHLSNAELEAVHQVIRELSN